MDHENTDIETQKYNLVIYLKEGQYRSPSRKAKMATNDASKLHALVTELREANKLGKEAFNELLKNTKKYLYLLGLALDQDLSDLNEVAKDSLLFPHLAKSLQYYEDKHSLSQEEKLQTRNMLMQGAGMIFRNIDFNKESPLFLPLSITYEWLGQMGADLDRLSSEYNWKKPEETQKSVVSSLNHLTMDLQYPTYNLNYGLERHEVNLFFEQLIDKLVKLKEQNAGMYEEVVARLDEDFPALQFKDLVNSKTHDDSQNVPINQLEPTDIRTGSVRHNKGMET